MAQLMERPRPIEYPYLNETRLDHGKAVGTVIAAMRTDIAFPHTIETLADIANYSPFHFARLFRMVTGATPGEFLSALRFDAARRLMLETPNSITDICFDVGFSSLGTFSTRFKQLVGLGPAEFRAMRDPLEENLPLLGLNCPRPTVTGVTVSGVIKAPRPTSGFLFIGLFPSAIPQGRPVAGTLTLSTGPFILSNVPFGTWRLLAALFPFGTDPVVHLLGTPLLQGMEPMPVVVAPGIQPRPLTLHLREPLLTDGPILAALAPRVLNL